jgi:hypothetical protein
VFRTSSSPYLLDFLREPSSPQDKLRPKTSPHSSGQILQVVYPGRGSEPALNAVKGHDHRAIPAERSAGYSSCQYILPQNFERFVRFLKIEQGLNAQMCKIL